MQKKVYTKETLSTIPEVSGVYILKNKEGEVVYIGKAKNLKSRLKSHFQKSLSWKENSLQEFVTAIEVLRLSSDFEALIQESELIKKYKPKYNVIWKDDKHYIYLLITKEEYPKIRYARKKDEKNGYFYGPYPSAGTVRDLVALTRTIIPFCTQKNVGKRACFYKHIGLCNPCPSEIIHLPENEKKEMTKVYKNNLKLIRYIFEGKIKKLERYLAKEMAKCKEAEEYEKAALFRDRITNLRRINQYADYQETKESTSLEERDTFQKEEENLKAALKDVYPGIEKIDWVECYDISNISGKHATGSMVTFFGGEPYKDRYRRFKIRLKDTPDDFFMMRETLSRRLTHKEWPLPNLFVIDGGKGQVQIAKDVLQSFNVTVPVIGLAKRLEEIVIPQNNAFKIVLLEKNNPGLHLLQRVRDEAHRFAHKYHEHLRLKNLLNT